MYNVCCNCSELLLTLTVVLVLSLASSTALLLSETPLVGAVMQCLDDVMATHIHMYMYMYIYIHTYTCTCKMRYIQNVHVHVHVTSFYTVKVSRSAEQL